jgi:CRP/FNR family transcriptional regulator
VIHTSAQDRVKAALPLHTLLGSDLSDQFLRQATLARLPTGRDVMAERDRVQAIPLVLSGSIRVYKIGESGREITLYRFTRGEWCVLTADSIAGHRLFPARAQVEEEAELHSSPPRYLMPGWEAQHLGANSCSVRCPGVCLA